MKKVWKNILNDYQDLNIQELDYDMDSEEVAKYNPGKVLPVTIFLDNNGKELTRLIGEQKENIIKDNIDKYRWLHEKNIKNNYLLTNISYKYQGC